MKIRNYGSVQRAEVAGITFLLGWIPRFKFQELIFHLETNEQAARRRALLALRAEKATEGLPPPSDDDVWQRMYRDRAYFSEMVLVKEELVAWGVRGHEGLFDEDGGAVAFEGVEREFQGQRFPGASDVLAARYADAGLLTDLYVAVLQRNRLDDEAKKNSPPPSPSAPSPGGGLAGTA